MDRTDFAHPYETLRPVESVPAYGFSADTAARMAYAERGSYGEMLAKMFAEAEQMPDRYGWDDQQENGLEQSVGHSDSEAFRAVMKTVYAKLKDSDAVNRFRHHGDAFESEHDVEAIFNAYDRALDKALDKNDLTDRQEAKINFASRSELDWTLRDLITHHALESGQSSEHSFEPSDYLLILDPKIRKIDYLDSKQILGVLRRSASVAGGDRLKADLSRLRASERQEAQAALAIYEQGSDN